MLKLQGVSFRYPGQENWACREVYLHIEPGTILGLLGENGAGKSTLASVIRGQLSAQKGRIEGRETRVGLVHQNPLSAPGLKVWKEIYCGKEHHSGAFFRVSKLKHHLRELQNQWGIHLNLDQDHGRLNRRELQQAEWLEVLLEDPELVILDEPDFSGETSLGDLLDRLKAQHKSVLLITHQLKEALDHCDALYLMRQGRLSPYHGDGISQREPPGEIPRVPPVQANHRFPGRNPLLDITSLCRDNLNHGIYPGDRLVILGYRESGLAALEEQLLGFPQARGFAYIPSEGQIKALDSSMSLGENLQLHHQSYQGGPHAIKNWFRDAREKLKRGPWDFAPEEALEKLSGGNRQRLLIYREMDHWRSILIAAEPCRNLDGHRRREIHEALMDQHQDPRSQERGLIYLTNDPQELEESPELATHLGLLYQGKIQRILQAPFPPEKELYRHMMGELL